MKKILFLLTLSLIISSCSSKKKENPTVEKAYLEAYKLLEEKDYDEAASKFEKIDDEYPFSKWATKAQVMSIYARYRSDDHEKTVTNSEDFIRLNPANKFVPYAMYMKGISYYNIIPSIKRAQDDTVIASKTFRELIARFRESEYAKDARTKLPFIDEHLAGHKMSIGRYEIKERNYVGAAMNFNEVISRYRMTKQVPEAYFRLIEIYSKIGLKTEAQKIETKLVKNFPDSYWAKQTLIFDDE